MVYEIKEFSAGDKFVKFGEEHVTTVENAGRYLIINGERMDNLQHITRKECSARLREMKKAKEIDTEAYRVISEIESGRLNYAAKMNQVRTNNKTCGRDWL